MSERELLMDLAAAKQDLTFAEPRDREELLAQHQRAHDAYWAFVDSSRRTGGSDSGN